MTVVGIFSKILGIGIRYSGGYNRLVWRLFVQNIGTFTFKLTPKAIWLCFNILQVDRPQLLFSDIFPNINKIDDYHEFNQVWYSHTTRRIRS